MKYWQQRTQLDNLRGGGGHTRNHKFITDDVEQVTALNTDTDSDANSGEEIEDSRRSLYESFFIVEFLHPFLYLQHCTIFHQKRF